MNSIAVPLQRIQSLVEGRKKLLDKLENAPIEKGDQVLFKDLASVRRLANELDVPVSSILDGAENDLDEGIKIGRSKGAFARTSERGGRNYYTYNHLVTTNAEPNLMALRVQLHAKSEDVIALNAGHGSKEIVYVTKGRVQIDWQPEGSAPRKDILHPGDSVYVSPHVPHSFTRVDDDAEIIAVNY